MLKSPPVCFAAHFGSAPAATRAARPIRTSSAPEAGMSAARPVPCADGVPFTVVSEWLSFPHGVSTFP